MIHWYRAALRHPPESPADPRVTVPTLLIWGARDRFLGPGLAKSSLAFCERGRLRADRRRHALGAARGAGTGQPGGARVPGRKALNGAGENPARRATAPDSRLLAVLTS